MSFSACEISVANLTLAKLWNNHAELLIILPLKPVPHGVFPQISWWLPILPVPQSGHALLPVFLSHYNSSPSESSAGSILRTYPDVITSHHPRYPLVLSPSFLLWMTWANCSLVSLFPPWCPVFSTQRPVSIKHGSDDGASQLHTLRSLSITLRGSQNPDLVCRALRNPVPSHTHTLPPSVQSSLSLVASCSSAHSHYHSHPGLAVAWMCTRYPYVFTQMSPSAWLLTSLCPAQCFSPNTYHLLT